MRKSSVCVLVSGGLDSDALVGLAAQQYERVYPVYVVQGLRWERVEQYWLRRFLKAFDHPRVAAVRAIHLPMRDLYGRHWSTGHGTIPGARTPDRAVYLPGRNLALTVKAGIFCSMRGISRLWLGSLGHNPFPDATPGFFRDWSGAMSRGLGRRVFIEAPLRTLSKTEVIGRFQNLPLALSFSCIQPRGYRHCGSCNKCAERRKAFRLAGVPDQTSYA
jgi:7-cyano-7-deazaguanine synthase